MRLLILGGTVFLGRAIVETALARGHSLTLFHRGQSNPNLFTEAEHVFGDREEDLASLEGRSFDACIDTCGYVPRVVQASVEALADSIRLYAFVSSLSVYSDPSPDGTDEEGTVGTLEDPTVEEITGETYGPLKALCEDEVTSGLGERALILRPGLIVGPHDPSDHFSYWPHRIAQGGEVLAPGQPDRNVQLIDVRDLASWIVGMLEERETGLYNAVSPPGMLSMASLLDACFRAAGSNARLRWIDDTFLVERSVGPWMELPLWIPEEDPMARGFFEFRIDRAIAKGLTFRPIEETARDTLSWLQARPADHQWRAGITREREASLLEEWADAQA